MPSLADLQASVRLALTSGHVHALAPILVGGDNALKRLAIHQRHFDASLVSALLEKFPATAWLVGSDFLTGVARAFVRTHPPQRPCIAEYGEDFPRFIASYEGGRVPYLRQFAEMEWQVGQVSIAVDEPALTWSELARVGADALSGVRLGLQSGLRYVHGTWAIDRLMKVYLAGSPPDRFALVEGDAWIEVRGARGDLWFSRLDRATFTFRASLLEGQPLGSAAERALGCDEGFGVGRALTALVADGLVTIVFPEMEA